MTVACNRSYRQEKKPPFVPTAGIRDPLLKLPPFFASPPQIANGSDCLEGNRLGVSYISCVFELRYVRHWICPSARQDLGQRCPLDAYRLLKERDRKCRRELVNMLVLDS